MQTIELVLDIAILIGLIVCVVMMRRSYQRARLIFDRLHELEAAAGMHGQHANEENGNDGS